MNSELYKSIVPIRNNGKWINPLHKTLRVFFQNVTQTKAFSYIKQMSQFIFPKHMSWYSFVFLCTVGPVWPFLPEEICLVTNEHLNACWSTHSSLSAYSIKLFTNVSSSSTLALAASPCNYTLLPMQLHITPHAITHYSPITPRWIPVLFLHLS